MTQFIHMFAKLGKMTICS